MFITTDDFCPKFIDLWSHWDKLKQAFPQLKVTVFVVPEWDGISSYNIGNSKEFIDWYNNRHEWVEICWHGFNHAANDCTRSREEMKKDMDKYFTVMSKFMPKNWGFKPPFYKFNSDMIDLAFEYGAKYFVTCSGIIYGPGKEIKPIVIETHTNSITNVNDRIDKAFDGLMKIKLFSTLGELYESSESLGLV